MEYRFFGNSNLKVSTVGFGTWPIGGTATAEGYGGVDDAEAIAAIRRALDLGITCFDTAPAYGLGRAETILGKALGADRKNVVVVTKCGIPWDPTQGKFGRNSSYSHIMESTEASLRFLDTNYIDVLLIHWPDPETPLSEPMRALKDLQTSGKVRHIGVSNFSTQQVEECLTHTQLAVQQIGYNLFDRRREAELPWLRERNVGVMAYGPLAHGLLAGAFTPETTFGEKDWRASGKAFGLPIFEGENFQKNVAVVEKLKLIAAAHGKTVAQLALAWVLRRPEVTVALIGARKPSEIEASAQVAGWTLSDIDLAQIADAMQGAAGNG
jgi:aryl-alcohol dehydrogenase-like predicted oxidoreductase